MPPLNSNFSALSPDDVDMLLVAIDVLLVTDFSSVWGKKRQRHNYSLARVIANKLENEVERFSAEEINLMYVALCNYHDYLTELQEKNALTADDEMFLYAIPSLSERFALLRRNALILEFHNR